MSDAASVRTSPSTESTLRLERNFPWWKPSPQYVHPPAHPRETMMESLTVANAGIGST
jgi:hypothetical protein